MITFNSSKHIGKVLIGIVLLISGLMLTASAEIKCAYCGKPIVSQYLEHDNKYYHINCYNKRDIKKCGHCGKDITSQYYEKDSKFYHVDCYEKYIVEKCAHCGKAIVGQYYEIDGKLYHSDCYKQNIADKCAHCGKPLTGEYIEAGGKHYHNDCYDNYIALRCAVCGQIIRDEYKVDYWGNKIHPEHYDRLPQCEHCSRLISENTTGGGVTYSDGRHVCNICKKTAVTDPDLAYRLMEKVMERLKSLGIEIKHKGIKLHLVDRQTLWKHSGSHKPRESGLAQCESNSIAGLFKVRKYNIYVLTGMPQVGLETILAHELMHVWLYSHGRESTEPALCEGSCQYAAYMYLNRSVDKMAKYEIQTFMDDSDPIYGEGFRRVKRLVAERGPDFWLEHIKKNDHFPDGY